ncbi:hypothetical protein D3C78_1891220 [compost metagenome]
MVPVLPNALRLPPWLSRLPMARLRLLLLSMMPLRLFSVPLRLKSIRPAATLPDWLAKLLASRSSRPCA